MFNGFGVGYRGRTEPEPDEGEIDRDVARWQPERVENVLSQEATFGLRARDSESASEKRKRYRRTEAEFDPSLITVITTVLRVGGTKKDACAMAGITTQTLRNWIRKGKAGDPFFVDLAIQVQQARCIPKLAALQKLQEAISRRDVKAITWWLEKAYPDEYGAKASIDHTGKLTIQGLSDALAAIPKEVKEQLDLDEEDDEDDEDDGPE